MWHFSPEQVWQVIATAIAGAAGGVVRAISQRDGFKQFVSDVLVGSILAIYFGEAAAEIVAPILGIINADDAAPQLGPFLCGVAGMLLVEIIVDAVKKRGRDMEK